MCVILKNIKPADLGCSTHTEVSSFEARGSEPHRKCGDIIGLPERATSGNDAMTGECPINIATRLAERIDKPSFILSNSGLNSLPEQFLSKMHTVNIEISFP